MPARWAWAPALLACVVGRSASSPGEVASSSSRVVFELVPISRGGKEAQAGNSDGRRHAARRLRSNAQGNGVPPGTHECKLGNYNNVQYNLEILVGRACGGTAGQRFQVVPDTGSSDLWIPSSNCTFCNVGTRRYHLERSCSAEPLGERVTFKYGDGTVANGSTFRDLVRVGDLEVRSQFLVQVDAMESATHMESDGILGLAHHYASDKGRKGQTFMSKLFEDYPHLPQQFSFYLTGDSKRSSTLVFGDPDLEHHAKEREFQYGKGYYMQHTDLWLTSVWSIGWSGTDVEVSFPERGTLGTPALIDSGSSLIVLAPDIYDRIVGELRSRFSYCQELQTENILSCECPPDHELSRLPWLVINAINANDQQFSLCMSPDEYILESTDVQAPGTCVLALQRGSYKQPVPMIFGMTFLRSFYTTFDLANHRIGFARSNISPLPAGAQCAVIHPASQLVIWFVAAGLCMLSLTFAAHVIFAKGCPCAVSTAGVMPSDTPRALGLGVGDALPTTGLRRG